MNVFLEAAYTDRRQIDLIALGLVAEDGATEFYAERNDFNRSFCSAFARAAVLPLLDAPEHLRMTRDEMSRRLQGWFAALPGDVRVVCVDRLDFDLLVDAMDGCMPPNLRGMDDLHRLLADPAFHQATLDYHDAPGHPWHHALHDARANRLGWLAWSKAAEKPATGDAGGRRWLERVALPLSLHGARGLKGRPSH